jgi:hypothetical protein
VGDDPGVLEKGRASEKHFSLDGVRIHPTLGGSAATGHYQSFKSSLSVVAWRESSVPLPLAHPSEQNVEHWAGGINQMRETTHETFAPLLYSGKDRPRRK